VAHRLTFNTPQAIKDGGPSTKALQDPTPRALGYAIDKAALVDKVLGAHGLVGARSPAGDGGREWHLEPKNLGRSTSRPPSQSARPATKLDARASALTRKASRSTCGWSCEGLDDVQRECGVHHRLVEGLGIDMTTRALDKDA
jgi:hypothetical protein